MTHDGNFQHDSQSPMVLNAIESTLTTVADVPADAVNAMTGTGKNLGWFGKVDRGLDPRNPEQWADASSATDGLSGASAAVTGVTTHSVGQVFKGASDGLASSDAVPSFLKPILGNSSALAGIVAVVAGLLLLNPLLQVFGAVAEGSN